MQVISLLSRKGGVGKTSLAIHWAVEASEKGDKQVVLVDMDDQQSCSSWYRKREAKTPVLIQSNSGDIAEHIKVCRTDGVDLVVIDTSPDIDASAVKAARVSDLVVIPVRPSVLDLEAIAGTVQLVKGLGKRAVMVLNQAPPRSTVTAEAAIALGGYGLEVCPVAIASRLSFSRALIDGRVASEIEPKGKAAAEINACWNWIVKQLNNN